MSFTACSKGYLTLQQRQGRTDDSPRQVLNSFREDHLDAGVATCYFQEDVKACRGMRYRGIAFKNPGLSVHYILKVLLRMLVLKAAFR